VEALLAFCGLDEAKHEGPGGALSSLHDARRLLEAQLGMLRLRAANDLEGGNLAANDNEGGADVQDTDGNGGDALAAAAAAAAAAAEEEEECNSADGDGDGGEEGGEDDAASAVGGEACDEATWAILAHLLGFAHTFEPSHCARILYASLGPALLSRPTLLDCVRPLVATLARAALLSSRLNFATEVAPYRGDVGEM